MNAPTASARRAEARRLWAAIRGAVGALPRRNEDPALVPMETAYLALVIGVPRRQTPCNPPDPLERLALARWTSIVEDFTTSVEGIAWYTALCLGDDIHWIGRPELLNEFERLASLLFEELFTAHRDAYDAITDPGRLLGDEPNRRLQGLEQAAQQMLALFGEAADATGRGDPGAGWEWSDRGVAHLVESYAVLQEQAESCIKLAVIEPPSWRCYLSLDCASDGLRNASRTAHGLRTFLANTDRDLIVEATRRMADPARFLEELDQLIGGIDAIVCEAKCTESALARVWPEAKRKAGRPADRHVAHLTRAAAGTFSRVTGRRPDRVSAPIDIAHGHFECFLETLFDALGVNASAERATRRYVEDRRAEEALRTTC